MAYIDKTFYHDSHDREIELRNHKDGWEKEWDLENLTLRTRVSGDENCLSIEVWPHKGDCVELILSRENAEKLATRIMMSLAEMNTETMLESCRNEISEIQEQLFWLEDIIEEEKEAHGSARKEKNETKN